MAGLRIVALIAVVLGLLGAASGSVAIPPPKGPGNPHAPYVPNSPAWLMAKGLSRVTFSHGEGGWRLRCSKRWRPAGHNWWLGRCQKVYKRDGRGYRSNFYKGRGLVILRRSHGIYYWSYEYDIREFRRGCTPEVIEAEPEPPVVGPAGEIIVEGDPGVPIYIGCRERFRRVNPGEQPIILR